MAGGGFIGGGNNRTGEIHGTSGQVNQGITSSGKVPMAVPAITTYQGKTTKDIKVTVDNKTRIIYAELTDSFLKQKGITKVWYDANPNSADYQWLCYTIPLNEQSERIVKVAKLPTFADLTTLETNLTAFVNSVKQELENKINKKQDKIQFVEIYSTEGILDEESLNALKNNLCNAIIYNGTLYKLSIKDGRMRKYFSNLNASEDNLIDVNIDTGEYILHSALDPVLQNHINDKVIHISQHDRDFWNKKRAYANLLEGENYELVISDELSRDENR